MGVDANAVIEVRAIGTEKAGKQFTQFENTVTRSMSASESSVARAFANMAAQYLSLAYTMRKATQLMSSGVEFNKFVETQTMSFSVMMKSAEKAKVQMKDLYDFAVKSPLTFKETASSAKQLMAYGFTAKELIPTLDKLGTVALATGHSLSDIAYVYGTLKSQGRAYSRDLMQFGMRGIPIYEELAKVMKVNVSQIQKMASEGKIGFKEVERAFESMTGAGGRFSGMMDQYMETLTGKLAMLADISEQSAGKVMRGATESYKKFIDDLTKMLQSASMQEYFNELGVDVKNGADALFAIVKGLMELLPLLTKALKLYIAFKASEGIFKGLKALPEVLLNIGGALMNIAGTGKVPAFLGELKAAGFLFKDGLLLALPILSEMVLIVGAILGPILAIKDVFESLKRYEAFKQDKQLATESLVPIMEDQLPAIKSQISKMGLSELDAQVEYNKQIALLVADYANEYGLVNAELAQMLYTSKLINGETAKLLGFDVAGYFARVHAEAAQANTKIYTTAMEREMRAFSELTGKSQETFFDPTDSHAYGARAANMYIKTFADKFEGEKIKWKDLFDMDKMQDLWKEELDALKKKYDEMFAQIGESGMEGSGFGITMRKRINELMKLIDDSTKKAKQLAKLPSLGDWWLPQESAVAASTTAIDDAVLGMEKTLFNAQKEIDARREVMILNRDAAGNIIDANKWQIELNKLLIEEGKIRADINKAQARVIGTTKYSEQTEGVSGFFDDLKTKAAEAFEKGYKKFADGTSGFNFDLRSNISGMGTAMGTSVQGTEVGGLVSGGNPFAMAIIAIAEFVMSIESVTKVLNPFKTILEQTRSVVEPLVTGILEPMTNVLKMSGDLLSQILAPILGIMKILNVLTYVLEVWVFVPLQILGAGFKWFYNSIVVTVGNWIINIVNAIIKVLNKIPFVHIKYISTLKKVSDSVEDFSESLSNGTNALGATIDYLSAKLRDMYDSQLDSLQELYEVGAVTATEYEKQVQNLQETMLNMDDPLVSIADQQLNTQEGILQRLYELYALQDLINSGELSEEDLSKILGEHGITTESLEATMMGAITKSLGAIDKQKAEADAAKAAEEARKAAEAAAKLAAEVAAAKLASAKQQATGYGTSLTKAVTKDDILIKNMTKSAEYKTDLLQARKASGAAWNSITQMYFDTAYAARWRKAKLLAFQEDLAAVVAQSTTMNTPEAIAAVFKAFKARWADFISDKTFKAMGISYDVGTGRVPKDMVANIHKGEGIIPKTFMDSIRSGELTLSGNRGTGQNVYVTVQVAGSVVAERDLAETISGVMYKMRSKGLVTT